MKTSADMIREAWDDIHYPQRWLTEREIRADRRRIAAIEPTTGEYIPFSSEPVTISVADVGIKNTIADELSMGDAFWDAYRRDAEDAVFRGTL